MFQIVDMDTPSHFLALFLELFMAIVTSEQMPRLMKEKLSAPMQQLFQICIAYQPPKRVKCAHIFVELRLGEARAIDPN